MVERVPKKIGFILVVINIGPKTKSWSPSSNLAFPGLNIATKKASINKMWAWV
jgi:hypothetical protein